MAGFDNQLSIQAEVSVNNSDISEVNKPRLVEINGIASESVASSKTEEQNLHVDEKEKWSNAQACERSVQSSASMVDCRGDRDHVEEAAESESHVVVEETIEINSSEIDKSVEETIGSSSSGEVDKSVEETMTIESSSSEVDKSVEEIIESNSSEIDKSVEETIESSSSETHQTVAEANENKSCAVNSEPSVTHSKSNISYTQNVADLKEDILQVVEETIGSNNKSFDDYSLGGTTNGNQSCDANFEEDTTKTHKSCDVNSVEETANGSPSCNANFVEETAKSKCTSAVDSESATEVPVNNVHTVHKSVSTDYVAPLSNTDNLDRDMLSRVQISFDRPRDHVIEVTIPDTRECPMYALVLCAWSNILGPHAQYVWKTEGKHNFTSEMLNYLSTHTLTSSDQPRESVDVKMLILKDRGIVVTSFLFSGFDGEEKTVFSLSLVVPYVDRHWYLPLHEFCVSRLSMMVGKLRVMQEKYKEEIGDRAIEKFAEDVPKFIGVLTRLRTSSPGSKIHLQNTVFAVDRALDVHFTRTAIASHLQTCGCSIVLGSSVSEINMMIDTLAMFLTPAERRCCTYLDDDSDSRGTDKPENRSSLGYEKDLYLQGFLKDSINLSECMREVMVSTYPTSLIDMSSLEVRQNLPCNEHAYWRHEVLCHELQSLWLDSQEPMVYLPIVTFQNKSETETLVQNFQREINLLHPHSGVRDAYVEQFQRLLDRKAVGLIKYVEEETMRGSKTSRITIKKLKHDLDLNPEGNFRIILARAEKLKPGIFTVVCGNPAQMRDPSLQELPMS